MIVPARDNTDPGKFMYAVVENSGVHPPPTGADLTGILLASKNAHSAQFVSLRTGIPAHLKPYRDSDGSKQFVCVIGNFALCHRYHPRDIIPLEDLEYDWL